MVHDIADLFGSATTAAEELDARLFRGGDKRRRIEYIRDYILATLHQDAQGLVRARLSAKFEDLYPKVAPHIVSACERTYALYNEVREGFERCR